MRCVTQRASLRLAVKIGLFIIVAITQVLPQQAELQWILFCDFPSGNGSTFEGAEPRFHNDEDTKQLHSTDSGDHAHHDFVSRSKQ